MTEKVKGPASYFPSIEKTYGQPITHWLDLVQQQAIGRYSQQSSKGRAVSPLEFWHAGLFDQS